MFSWARRRPIRAHTLKSGAEAEVPSIASGVSGDNVEGRHTRPHTDTLAPAATWPLDQ